METAKSTKLSFTKKVQTNDIANKLSRKADIHEKKVQK